MTEAEQINKEANVTTPVGTDSSTTHSVTNLEARQSGDLLLNLN